MDQYFLPRLHTARACLLSSVLLLAVLLVPAGVFAQQLVDDFNRANNNTVGGGWTESETAAPASVRIESNQLLMGSTTQGRDYVVQSTPGTYNTTLTNNTCLLTWAFNMRQTRTDPSGFDNINYGIAVVLAGSNANLLDGTGYAVVLGNGGATDPIRLVRYSNGLDLNSQLTNLIAAGDFGMEYLDIRVTYDPLTDQWTLYYTNNGDAGPFGDPLLAATSAGSTIDNTYTGSSHPIIGCLWNHNTAADHNGRFDNFYVPDACTQTTVEFTGSAATVNETGTSTTLTVSITNPDATNATTADVVLVSGDASRIGNYTTQTVTFPAGSGANQTVTVNLTDNGACDGDEVLVFELQNVAGGDNAVRVVPFVFTLTVLDNEVTQGILLGRQAFDGLGSDNWAITSNSGTISTSAGAGDTPASQRILSGTASWQVSNQNVALELATLNVGEYDDVVIRARLSSTSTTTGNGAEANDQVRFYVDLDGGGFPGTADITVAGQTNARWGFSTGTGLATTTAGAPLTYAPTDGNQDQTTEGYSFIEIFIPPGTATVALRVEGVNNQANEVWNLEDIEIIGDRCRPIYYSRNSGSETDPIWSHTRTGTAGAATWGANATAVVQNGDVITTTGTDWVLRELDVENGGTVALGSTDLEVHGTALTNNGTFTVTTGAVRLPGDEALALGGSGNFDLFDLEVDGADVTLTSAELRIRNSLDILSGTFDANNTGNPARNLVLVSDATATGRLGPVPLGAFSGAIVMERYVPAGVTNWRLISAPTVNNTLSSLEDDFITAGYPGSHVPAFDDPPGSNILWPSIRTYDETDPGTNLNDGLIGATSDAMVMGAGLGFAAWCGTTLTNTAAFTIDLRSAPRQGPVTLPMSWTDTGTPTVDGWNLVGNPLPSPVDFGSISLGADVEQFYYVFDPVSGNNAAWDEALQVSIPGGSLNGNIQSFQGFWLKANGADVTTSVDESDKVLDPSGGGLFGGAQAGPQPYARLRLIGAQNDFFDETLVHFGVGGETLGAHDILKFPFSHPTAPRIMSRSTDGHDLMLNAWGNPGTDMAIPIAIEVPADGPLTLRVYDAEGIMGLSCLVLEDLVTGQSMPLTDGMEYLFTATAGRTDRFMLLVAAPVERSFSDVTCAGAADGSATVSVPGGMAFDVTWKDAFGTTILSEAGAVGSASIGGLAGGSYTVSVVTAACGDLTSPFTLVEPMAMATSAATQEAACASATNGAVLLQVMGGTAPHQFLWSNGTTDADLMAVAPGSYSVTITDAHGCELQAGPFQVTAGAGPQSLFLPSATEVLVGEPVEFFNLSTWGASASWSFGDGGSSSDAEPIHVYTLPGVWTVTLTIERDGCVSVSTMDIVVNSSVAIPEGQAFEGVNVFLDERHVVVDLQRGTADEVVITVLDAMGRKVAERRTWITSGRERIALDHVAQGTVLVRLVEGVRSRTWKLPLVR